MSRHLLSPKDVADAIGASESSVRRWIDGGQIATSRTAGGHRRVAVEEAIRYARTSGATVVRPDLLGLDLPRTRRERTAAPGDGERLFAALRAGDRAAARAMILGWYLDGRSLPALFDGPVRSAMHAVGELWRHERRGILDEHRATAISLGALAELRALIPPPRADAPVALGAAAPGDPYLIPTTMAGAVLADAGFHGVDFGADTPVELLAAEAAARGARLVWLSISLPELPPALRAAVRGLARGVEARGVDVVVGGRCVDAFKLRPSGNLVTVGSMTELAAFARGLRRTRAAPVVR